jgi:protein TonB
MTVGRDRGDGLSDEALRWALCCALILALHAGVAWMAIAWRPAAEEPQTPPPTVAMIDLAPMPVAPETPPSEIPPGPEQVKTQPPPTEPEVEEPPPPPSPAPQVEVPLPPKPPPKPHHRIIPHEPPKLIAAPAPPVPETTAPPRIEAPPALAPAAPAPTWQGLVLGRLEQFKRYPETAQFYHHQGVAYLRFAMDRQGKVLSASIEKSSGYDALDAEALALVHRAEPFPPPPPDVPGDPVGLVVPIEFFLKR